MPNLITIITPAYKAEQTIGRAVRSVMAQTHGDWEMIVISDDEKDYEAILKSDGISDKRLRFASTGQSGAGPSRGRNIGLDEAKGEYITTLDADDEYAPSYLAQMLAAAEVYGAAMVRLSHKRKADGGTEGLFHPNVMPEAYCTLARLEDCLVINGRAITMFARRLLKHRYLETIRHGEDFYFDVQFFGQIDVIPVFHEELYIYHHHEGSLTSNPWMSDEWFIENYKTMIGFLEKAERLSPHMKNSMLAMYHHRLFQNYLYLNAKAKGECKDFYEFMALHPEYFGSDANAVGVKI